MTNEDTTIDCLAIKREAQTSIYEDIHNMSHEEEIEYFHRSVASSRFKDWWNEIKTQTLNTSSQSTQILSLEEKV
jgi:hypothetical protein